MRSTLLELQENRINFIQYNIFLFIIIYIFPSLECRTGLYTEEFRLFFSEIALPSLSPVVLVLEYGHHSGVHILIFFGSSFCLLLCTAFCDFKSHKLP